MNRTKIEWCDWTWNPIVGCSPASAGCEHCYAEAIARRFGMPWGRPSFMPSRLGEPAKVKNPGRIFVCSMSDIGHERGCPLWRAEIRKAMAAAPWHTYIVLTKRPENLVSEDWSACWVGVTVEDQAAADRRVPELLKIRAKIHFVSVEPMLGPVDLNYAAFNGADSFQSMAGIDWVIAGPETGPKARPCASEWLENLHGDCLAAGVPFFDKQKSGWFGREWPMNPSCLGTGHLVAGTQHNIVGRPESKEPK